MLSVSSRVFCLSSFSVLIYPATVRYPAYTKYQYTTETITSDIITEIHEMLDNIITEREKRKKENYPR